MIITDRPLGPVLFTHEGAEFYPYEAVYAIGEIKSTYDAGKRPIDEFVSKIGAIRSQLIRQSTPPGMLRGGVRVPALSLPWNPRHRNVLFTFMLCVDPGDFDLAQVVDVYRDTPVDRLPHVLCLLGRGVLHRCIWDGQTRRLDPIFQDWDAGDDWRWHLAPWGEPDTLAGTYSFLLYSLLRHLEISVLAAPDHLAYLNRILGKDGTAQVIGRADKSPPP